MNPIFVDTSSLIAIGNKRDAFHLKALETRKSLLNADSDFVTTSAVLLEFGNAFSPVKLRHVAVAMIEAIIASKKWNCLELNDQLLAEGFDLYRRMSDKDWGLVDCISIVAAKKMGVNQIFTTDHHFEQAGFSILLKRSM